MGCKSNYYEDNDPCLQDDHCNIFVPPAADRKVTLEYTEYPESPHRTGEFNLFFPERESDAVMYPSFGVSADMGGSLPVSGGTCGKVTRAVSCFSTDAYVYDYVPNELSYDIGLSDRYFAYLYDTSDNAGHVGIACYYLEERSRSTTTASPGNDPETGTPIPGTTSTEGDIICHPCTSFSCATSKTHLSYSGTEDLTGDPDAPHPTLYGIGTDSKKIAFSYDSLSSSLPNGVVDLEMSYDGVTYTDVWDENSLTGVGYDSPQNPFSTGDNQLRTFEIFDLNAGTATGFRVKVNIESIADVDAEPGPTYSGVRWRVTELLSAGTGYAAGTVFQLSYSYTDPNNNVIPLTMNLRIKTVGPVQTVSGQSGFDVLRVNDTINGHTITRVFHTDLDNFPYHIVYVDGNGNDFAKDTQYTSNRNHVITVKAGFGIVDRAILVGVYEFLDKSVQYAIADVNKNAPDVFNTLIQPEVTLTVTNGRVTGATIVSGGSGWDTLGREPSLVVSGPQDLGVLENVDSYDQIEKAFPSENDIATLDATFTNGVLTAVSIVNPGAKYQDDNPPRVSVNNVGYALTDSQPNPAYMPEKQEDIVDTMRAIPGMFAEEDFERVKNNLEAPEKNVTEFPEPNMRLKLDDERFRTEELPQETFNRKTVEDWWERAAPKFDMTKEISELPISDDLKTTFTSIQTDDFALREQQKEQLIQDEIPKQATVKETYIETVQGPFSELPVASTYTKYMIRQYSPSRSRDVKLKITLSCEVAQEGCGHVPCSPTASVGGTTNNPDGSTTVTTYSPLAGPLGGGCRDWSATGTLKILNDLTAATNTFSDAIDAYGNPFVD